MLDHFRRLYEYDAWANSLVFSSIREQGDAGPDARRVFAHVLAAELIWLSRLNGEQSPVEAWTEMTLEQCGRYVRDLPKAWRELQGGLSDADLDERRVYTNSEGEEFATKIRDVLQHVITHSAHHRGQIARFVRAIGLTPAVTDFIAFDRTRD